MLPISRIASMSVPYLTLLLLLVLVYWTPSANSTPARIDFLADFALPANPFETVPAMEKRVKKLVNKGLKLALPYMMRAVTEIRLNSKCTHGFLKLVKGVMDIRDWAFKMVDALGKPSAGMLEGTATALGDYDECLEIAVPKNPKTSAKPPYTKEEEAFRGQYCMVQIHLPDAIIQAAMDYQAGKNRSHSVLANSKTFLRSLLKIAPRADIVDLRLGVCIPSTCTIHDLQAIVNEVVKFVKIEATTLRCETKADFSLTKEQLVILVVFGVFTISILVGTTYEILLRFRSQEPEGQLVLENKRPLEQYVLAFSACNNFKKLTSLKSQNIEEIDCTRGMKFISVCLYVVVATYATPHDFHFLKYRSAFHFYKFMEEWWFTVFANASAGIDTLFLITGLQITYRLWKKNVRNVQGRIKVDVTKFLVKWFFRLSCAQLLVIALFMCLPLIGSGPIWPDVVGAEIEKCRQKWWMNAIFVDNFWASSDTCLNHTWIVTTLMHLLVVAPFIMWILSRWSSLGILLNIVLILSSSVAIAMVTFVDDLPPAPAFYFLSFLNLSRIWDKLFIQAYDHLAPFSIGILLGHYIANHDKVKLSKMTVLFGWVLAIFCNMTVLCGLYGYRHGEKMEISLSAVYASLHRLVWSVGISWIVFACAYGYGGVVNSILSWKIFIPLDRITNLTYLLHPLILFLHGGQIREKMYMAHLDQAMYATAYIVFTIAFAAVCYISFYVPFTFIESNIWASGQTRRRRDRNSVEFSGKFKEVSSEKEVKCVSISRLYEIRMNQKEKESQQCTPSTPKT